jgi:ABC-type phosphate/phosphonate transport system substrate-binding protein
MYDWPEVHWANDALWAAIAERLNAAGIAAPEKLDRSRRFGEEWLDPNLVLSQVCGWPYATELRGKVRLVATPVYSVEGREGPNYSSAIVVRRDGPGSLADLRRRRFAFNSHDSLSGYVTLIRHMAQSGLGEADVEWVETGAHRASLLAVAEGRADLAAIDALAWALAQEHEANAAARLQVIAWTAQRPAPPLVTAHGRTDREVGALRAAVEAATASPETQAARAALHLSGLAVLDEADYAKIAESSA